MQPTAHPYNTIATQRAAILARLGKGPATGAQLHAECNVPNPSRRIHELRNEGHEIASQPFDQVNPDGSVNRVALYVLSANDQRQRDLFKPA